ncbi:MAG: UDP-glucose 4-epimerase GalE [Chitinispirillaceae bacterium]|nr:UDP-glucose 4-epimerase GalE [Chitinispirillaceae bacterium]
MHQHEAYPNMNLLIVGGAGYIGSHVTREFLDRGYACTVFDNLSSGCRQNLFSDARFIQGDIRSEREIADAMNRGFDGFVHLAAFKAAGESMVEPEKYAVNNISGTINLLNAAVAAQVPCCVFSSSAAVYGEPSSLPINENHPVQPENFYGFTKIEIERLLHWYDTLKSLRFAALRYFNAAGYDPDGRIRGRERNPANLLPVVMEVAAGLREELRIFGDDYETPDGTGVRDYVHVSDLAAAHVQAFEWCRANNKSLTVNLGSESGISVMEMLDAARTITGRAIPATVAGRRPGDPAKLVASSKRAQELLGWKAKHSDVATLVATTWKVYRDTMEQRH